MTRTALAAIVVAILPNAALADTIALARPVEAASPHDATKFEGPL